MRSSRTSGRRLPNVAVGIIAIVLVVFGLYLAFTKQLPFVGPGYQVKGVFRNAQNLAVKSPVRIAGVNVGTVTGVSPLPGSNAAEVTMQISDAGRPVHEDARLQLRPRLFLEGNLFVDVHPGSPSSKEAPNNFTFPIQQTSNSVQLDQLLTTLQADVRGNLQILLKNVGDAFQKYGGAEGLREVYKTGGPAFKNTAYVNEAFLGTHPHDLSHLITNFDKVAAALDKNDPQLRSLIVAFRRVTGAFAAQSQALQVSIHELPGVLEAARPVFNNLNASLPFVRAFAREALPGVRSSGPALAASTPFIRQLRLLVSKSELRGLTHDLRPTVPQLAKLTKRQIPFMEQSRALASCFNNVIIPWSNSTIPNAAQGTAGNVYQETAYGLVGIAGESRQGDANGQTIKVMAGGGPNTLAPLGSLGALLLNTVQGTNGTTGVVTFPLIGSEPTVSDSPKTPFKPSVPCENQQPPNLATITGPAPNQQTFRVNPSEVTGFQNSELGKLTAEGLKIYQLGAKAGASGNKDQYKQYLKLARDWYQNGDAVRFMHLMEQETGHKLPGDFIKTQLAGFNTKKTGTTTGGTKAPEKTDTLQNKNRASK